MPATISPAGEAKSTPSATTHNGPARPLRALNQPRPVCKVARDSVQALHYQHIGPANVQPLKRRPELRPLIRGRCPADRTISEGTYQSPTPARDLSPYDLQLRIDPEALIRR
jgi:hypothetical protein